MPKLKLALSFFALLFPLLLHAQKAIDIASQPYENLGKKLGFYEDTTTKLTIYDVSSPDFQANFKPGKKDIFGKGVTRNAYWIKMVYKPWPVAKITWFLISLISIPLNSISSRTVSIPH
ncbi:hypothetical protein FW774_13555 [Pedobacter sp. BS3]|nr:7TM-DISM domain-containing protein [Pedobacter sp. BS3]TZF82530.1 hypothetical protein FW774_13555 [Pedobacter sp. BS3]